MKPYFAFGSNLWRQQMQQRCPGHRLLGHGVLAGYRWIISSRGYANIVPDAAEVVQGLVYTLNAADEAVLDRYEGVAEQHYHKLMLPVRLPDQGLQACLVYVDTLRTDAGRPWPEYIVRINHGIRDAGLDAAYVTRCIRPFVPDQPIPVS